MHRHPAHLAALAGPAALVTPLALLVALLAALLASQAAAHGVDDNTRSFLVGAQGLQPGPFLYIGARHMVTGYDHLLFLFGVVFLLTRTRDVLVYVTLFTIGHSLTLLGGVLADLRVNAYLVDAVIGVSVIYKGFDNLGGFQALFGRRPEPRAMVLAFGLAHGLGLATKLLEFELPRDHLPGNLLAFNLGVELGQLLALSLILALITLWRGHRSFAHASLATNTLLMAAGVVLVIYQLSGYYLEVTA